MAHNVILVTPTHKVGEDGWHEATLQRAISSEGKFEKIGDPWLSDSIHLYGELNIDFENDGDIVIWHDDNEIFVRDNYGTKIFGGKEIIDKYLHR